MSDMLDVEGIRRILLESGHREYTCTMTITLLEKTPEDAAATFVASLGTDYWGESEETYHVEDDKSLEEWEITDVDGEIEPVVMTPLEVIVRRLSDLDMAEILHVLTRFMAYDAEISMVTEAEVVRRLDSLIKKYDKRG